MTVTKLSPPEPAVAPRLLPLRLAALYCGISYWTMRDLCLNGVVPVVRVPSGRIPTGRARGGKQPGRVRIPASDPRARRLRKVLVDVADLDVLIEAWKDAR